ncbi:MAG: isoleucine--tRNA ligase [Anaerolineae bacterium]
MTFFDAVPLQPDWPSLEEEILAVWRRGRTFEALVAQNEGGDRWSFLDGPITANNPMAVHHAWGRTYKDVWQRYHAMRGHSQLWQNGFDCQGLWVEVEVEKELGFGSKRDIEAFGIAEFVGRCKERVLRFAAQMTEQSIRLGMWMHWDDPDQLRWLADNIGTPGQVTVDTPAGPVTDTVESLVGRLGSSPWKGSYFTFSDENNYTIWSFLKRCHDKGWIYRGTDVMPWCTRCGTGLSQHEIATEGYQQKTHRSPTLRLPLRDRPGEALLVWTTTPWTLPANVAAAVGPELTYLRVRQGDEVLWVAEGAAASALVGDYQVEGKVTGADMIGWTYDGPFDDLPATAEAAAVHRVIAWDEVGAEEGTGIVHIAPGAGAEDFALGKKEDLLAIAPLGEDGRYLAGFGDLTGRDAHEVADDIIAALEATGRLYRAADHSHRYPVCWRCQSELVFRLVDEWFISMGPVYDKPRGEVSAAEKAASLRYQVMDVAEAIHWVPGFGRDRELDWLRNMHDWMISKKRYWGLALPIWQCDDCGAFDVIGGREELADRAVEGWTTFDGHSPHRPYVDAVKVKCPQCGGLATRVPDVGNPWLDAGSVPFSTLGYRTDREHWARWFPADFITECCPGQFRNWFYSLLVMSTVFEDQEPFKAVLGYGTLLAEDGREMHKSWGNAIGFDEAADRVGADVMRWMFMSQRPEQNLRFGYHGAAEVRRRFLLPLWNVYGFFVQYANAAGWSPEAGVGEAALGVGAGPGAGGAAGAAGATADSAGAAAQLDRWILLRLDQVAAEVSQALDGLNPKGATAALEAFVADLSNWYVRRSRRRFWDGEPGALITLHKVLLTLTRLLAPFVPFTAEAIYRNLALGHGDGDVSVHLTPWPRGEGQPTTRDEALLADMGLVMRLAALGRAARSTADVKLRQPLARALVAVPTPAEAAAVKRLARHLRDELNVKAVEIVAEEGELVVHTVRPVLPILGPKYGRRVPAIRAALGEADTAAVVALVTAGERVTLALDAGEVTLEPAEVEVMAQARPGLATAEEAGYVVGIATEVTPELEAEGIARDIVRHVNQLRKDAGLAITDRVALAVDAPAEVAAAVDRWRDYIAAETLAVAVDLGALGPDASGSTRVEVRGQEVGLAVTRQGAPAAAQAAAGTAGADGADPEPDTPRGSA